MKFYKQTAEVKHDENGAELEIHYSVSQSEASAKRAEWGKRKIKREHMKTEEIDVPTDKKGLQEFLNSGR